MAIENKQTICSLLATTLMATKDGRDVHSLTYIEEPESCMQKVFVEFADGGGTHINVTGFAGLEMVERIVNHIVKDKLGELR